MIIEETNSTNSTNSTSSSNSKNDKDNKYADTCTQSLPVLAGTFAAILTEGKTVQEMETLALFLDALANNIFFIASVTDKNNIIITDFPL